LVHLGSVVSHVRRANHHLRQAGPGVNSDMTTLNRTVMWVGILMMDAGVLVLK
jgi:hypothetical protein